MKKHIICFGDSNTHGFCADSTDCNDTVAMRFDESERWTCLLQDALGDAYLVLEEGLNGRTTVFRDPITEGLCGLDYIVPCLTTHKPVSLLIVMLGTNDTKERFGSNARCIGLGMTRLLRAAQNTLCWQDGKPNILLIAPPHIKDGIQNDPISTMGAGCVEKSRGLSAQYQAVAQELGCHFWDACDCAFNDIDFMHLTRAGHYQMHEKLAELVPTLC